MTFIRKLEDNLATPLQTVIDNVAGRWVNVLDPANGVAADGSTDDTAAVQAIIDANPFGVLYFPPATYRFASKLTSEDPITLVGAPASFTHNGATASTIHGGTWFYFDHSDYGIEFGTGDGSGNPYPCGFLIDTIAFIRDQPTPATSWAPSNDAADIFVNWAGDVTIQNTLHFRSTKGIEVAGAGRINIYNVRGHFFTYGIYLDSCFDVVRIDQLHAWPFWIVDTDVDAYTFANLDVILSARNDDPFFSNIFGIFCHAVMRFTQSSAGKTAYAQCTNVTADVALVGIYIDTTVTGTQVDISNLFYSGYSSQNIGIGVYVQGSSCSVKIANYQSISVPQNLIRIDTGSGSTVDVLQVENTGYDLGSNSEPAFNAATGAIRVASVPVFSGTTGSGVVVSGTVSADYWVGYTATVASSSGTITTVGAKTTSYRRMGTVCTVYFDVTITTNGTGAGQLNISTPIYAGFVSVGSGREVNSTGYALAATASGNTIGVTRYDNVYPMADGYRAIGSVSYQV